MSKMLVVLRKHFLATRVFACTKISKISQNKFWKSVKLYISPRNRNTRIFDLNSSSACWGGGRTSKTHQQSRLYRTRFQFLEIAHINWRFKAQFSEGRFKERLSPPPLSGALREGPEGGHFLSICIITKIAKNTFEIRKNIFIYGPGPQSIFRGRARNFFTKVQEGIRKKIAGFAPEIIKQRVLSILPPPWKILYPPLIYDVTKAGTHTVQVCVHKLQHEKPLCIQSCQEWYSFESASRKTDQTIVIPGALLEVYRVKA